MYNIIYFIIIFLLIQSVYLLIQHLEMSNITQCSKTHENGATKICISSKCNINNPFICEQCEESHEHEGTLIAVRIKKINQIKQTMTQNQLIIRKAIQQIQNILNKVKVYFNDFMSQFANNDNILTDILNKLQCFFSSQPNKKYNENFGSIWNTIRENQSVIYKRKEKIDKLQKIQQIEQIVQNKQLIQKQNPYQVSQFITAFSQIYSFLNIQFISQPKQETINQLNALNDSIQSQQYIQKQQALCLSKTLQLCHQYKQSEKLYSRLLQINSMDLQVLNRRAVIRQKNGDFEGACEDLNQLISQMGQKIPNPGIYVRQRAQCYYCMQQWERAQKDLKKCLNKDTNSYEKLINCLQKQNKYQQAINFSEQLLKLKINDKDQVKIKIYSKIIQYAKLIKNHQLQSKYMQILQHSETDDLEILLKRAALNLQQLKYPQAISDYNKIIQKIPNNQSLYYNRAIAYFHLKKREPAITDLYHSFQINSNFSQAVNLLANLCFEQNQLQSLPKEVRDKYGEISLKCFKKLLQKDKNNHNYWHNIGFLLTQGDPKQAYKAYSQAVQIKKDFMPSYIGRIKLGLSLGVDSKYILKDIYQALSLGNRSPQIFYLKAILQENLNELEKALITIDLLLKTNPQNEEYLQVKVRILIKLNKIQESQPYLQKLKQISPQRAQKFFK